MPCLGCQLVELLEFIEKLIPNALWYFFDVESNEQQKEYPKSFGINITDLKEIGIQTEQFLSGVFIAMQENSKIENVDIRTEDDEYRTLNTDGVILEIRAFDTSYFEVYSDSYEIIKKIADHFNAKLFRT